MVDPFGLKYTYSIGNPCGEFIICDTKMAAQDPARAPELEAKGLDAKAVEGFEVFYDPIPPTGSSNKPCAGCCAKNCGHIRLIQVIKGAGRGLNVDDNKSVSERRGLPAPDGYPYAKKWHDNGQQYWDGPLDSLITNAHKKFEVCAVCSNQKGPDLVLGCAWIEFDEGQQNSDGKIDRSTRHLVNGVLEGETVPHPNGNAKSTCHRIAPKKPTATWTKAIDQWNKDSDSKK